MCSDGWIWIQQWRSKKNINVPDSPAYLEINCMRQKDYREEYMLNIFFFQGSFTVAGLTHPLSLLYSFRSWLFYPLLANWRSALWSEVTELITLNKSFAEVSEFLVWPISPFCFPQLSQLSSRCLQRKNQWNKIKSQKVPGNEWSCGPVYRKVSGSYSQAGRTGLAAHVSLVQDLATGVAGGNDAGSVAKPWMTSVLLMLTLTSTL